MSEQGRVINYGDAGVEALREEMRRDETIVYIGQGIGKPVVSGKSSAIIAFATQASVNWALPA